MWVGVQREANIGTIRVRNDIKIGNFKHSTIRQKNTGGGTL